MSGRPKLLRLNAIVSSMAVGVMAFDVVKFAIRYIQQQDHYHLQMVQSSAIALVFMSIASFFAWKNLKASPPN